MVPKKPCHSVTFTALAVSVCAPFNRLSLTRHQANNHHRPPNQPQRRCCARHRVEGYEREGAPLSHAAAITSRSSRCLLRVPAKECGRGSRSNKTEEEGSRQIRISSSQYMLPSRFNRHRPMGNQEETPLVTNGNQNPASDWCSFSCDLIYF